MDTKKRRRSCLRSEVLRKPATNDKSRLRYAQAFTDLSFGSIMKFLRFQSIPNNEQTLLFIYNVWSRTAFAPPCVWSCAVSICKIKKIILLAPKPKLKNEENGSHLVQKLFFRDTVCLNRRVLIRKQAGFLIKTGRFSYQNPPVSELYVAFFRIYGGFPRCKSEEKMGRVDKKQDENEKACEAGEASQTFGL